MTETKTIINRLKYRTPYNFETLLAFYAFRVLEGVELADETSYMRTVRAKAPNGQTVNGWVRVEDDPDRSELIVSMASSLAPAEAEVLSTIAFMFDVDSDPKAVAEGLASLAKLAPKAEVGDVRVPGCFDPFETACRAVLGQQISVKAANKLAARIVSEFGDEIETGIEGISRTWPTPETFLAFEDIEKSLGELGVIKTRSRVIREIARMLVSGELELGPNVAAEDQMKALLSIKGVGPWTANYVAMRTMGYPDAFLETDAGVAHALPEDMTPKERLTASKAWQPWRSYAVVALWNSLSA